MSRDLTRDDLRAILRRGLERTRGNFKLLVSLQPGPGDYKRLLNFLRKHQCQVALPALPDCSSACGR